MCATIKGSWMKWFDIHLLILRQKSEVFKEWLLIYNPLFKFTTDSELKETFHTKHFFSSFFLKILIAYTLKKKLAINTKFFYTSKPFSLVQGFWEKWFGKVVQSWKILMPHPVFVFTNTVCLLDDENQNISFKNTEKNNTF